MEIKLDGKGKDEGRTLILEVRRPIEEEQEEATEAQPFLEDECIITIGGESMHISGDELRRAVIALCPGEANLIM